MQRLYNLLRLLFIIPCFLSWLPVETLHATSLQFITAPVHNTMFFIVVTRRDVACNVSTICYDPCSFTMFFIGITVETLHATSLQFATAPVHNTMFFYRDNRRDVACNVSTISLTTHKHQIFVTSSILQIPFVIPPHTRVSSPLFPLGLLIGECVSRVKIQGLSE